MTALDDCRPHATAAQKVFASIAENRSGGTAQEVAGAIFEAAADGSDRLRYVATEGIKQWVAARRETSEEEYLALMRREVTLKTS
jgi:hypothetical protein